MAESSKELLDQPSKPSLLESLLVRGGKPARRGGDLEAKPLTTAVPRSQFLDKATDFLRVIAEANQKLELDVRERSPADYDVEVLTGNEKECIEMDLLLGVADLHTDEAVAAAEAAMGDFRPAAPSYSDDDSDEDGDLCELRSARENKRPKIVVLERNSG